MEIIILFFFITLFFGLPIALLVAGWRGAKKVKKIVAGLERMAEEKEKNNSQNS